MIGNKIISGLYRSKYVTYLQYVATCYVITNTRGNVCETITLQDNYTTTINDLTKFQYVYYKMSLASTHMQQTLSYILYKLHNLL